MTISSYGVEVSANPPAAVGWSRGGRLPYETRSATPAREFRDELRRTLGEVVALPGQVLHARLISPGRPGEVVDTENVLLYNLNSTAALAPSCRHGVRFERSFSQPDRQTFPAAEHLHVYALVSRLVESDPSAPVEN